MHRRSLVAATTAALLLGTIGAAPSLGAAKYKNCTAMNQVYPHGVGRQGARDKTSGTPVTNFKVSNRVYAANRASDRDKDGIACEKR
jgi:Excalibur calcium-binding domain